MLVLVNHGCSGFECIWRLQVPGIEIAASGRVVKASHLLDDLLTNVSKVPLRPQQKLFVMRVHLVPKVLHQLVLGEINNGQLLKMDHMMHNSVRRCLKLPRDTPIGFIHAKMCDGHLAVPSFCALVPGFRLLEW